MIQNFFTGRFLKTASRFLLPWGLVVPIAAYIAYVIYLFINPIFDYQQGITALIMFIHVPASWLALGLYFSMSICALAYLVWRTNMAYLYSRSICEMGLMMTVISLVTGSLWGKPMWGTYWVFDARLTSMLLLGLIYFALLLSFHNAKLAARNHRNIAVLILVGFVNIPVIKFSVDWWSTLHQPASILRSGGVAMDADFLIPLLASFSLLSLQMAALVFARTNILVRSHKQQQNDLLRQRKEAFA